MKSSSFLDKCCKNTQSSAGEDPAENLVGIGAMRVSALMMLLGLGYWIQGFRCFPWLGVGFYLKDNLRVDPSTLQLLLTSANLPMVAKPIYGIISDAVYIAGEHRLPYIILGGFLQVISWGSIVFIPAAGSSVSMMTAFLLLSNLGASIVEVANDALVAESGKKDKGISSGELQSFACMASAAGGVMGNLLGGISISQVDARTMFIIFAILLGIQTMICVTVNERSFNLSSSQKVAGRGAIAKSVQKQFSELLGALRKPEISYSLAWFAVSYAMIPILTGTMFFYQTQHLKLDPTIVGLAKVIGQIGLLLGSILYSQYLKSFSLRTLLGSVQILLSLCMLSDIFLVKQYNVLLGIPNSVYILGASALVEVISQFKILPFTVMLAQLCPPGCEGSLMAFVMSVQSLAAIVSGYLGVALASMLNVSSENYSGLPLAIFIQSIATLVPLIWISLIPDQETAKKRQEDKSKVL